MCSECKRCATGNVAKLPNATVQNEQPRTSFALIWYSCCSFLVVVFFFFLHKWQISDIIPRIHQWHLFHRRWKQQPAPILWHSADLIAEQENVLSIHVSVWELSAAPTPCQDTNINIGPLFKNPRFCVFLIICDEILTNIQEQGLVMALNSSQKMFYWFVDRRERSWRKITSLWSAPSKPNMLEADILGES